MSDGQTRRVGALADEPTPGRFGIGRLQWRGRDAVIVAEAPAGRITLWNAAAEALLGYSADEARVLDFMALAPAGLGEQTLAAIAANTTFGRDAAPGLPLRLTLRHKVGDERAVEATLAGAEDAAGRFVVAVLREAGGEASAEDAHTLTTLLEVSRSLTSTLELAPLIDVILAQLRLVADYAGATVSLVEGDALTLVANRLGPRPGMPPRAALEGMRLPLAKGGAILETLGRREPVLITEMRDDTPYTRAYRDVMGELLGERLQTIRSWLAVPLVYKDRVIGLIALSHGEPGFYTLQHARLAFGIANHAAIAIENARLYEQTQAAVSKATALAQIAANVALGGSLETVLNALAHNVVQASGAVACAVLLAEGDPPRLRIVGGHGLPAGYAAAYNRIERGDEPSFSLAVFAERRPRLLRNVWATLLKRPQYEPIHRFAGQVEWDTIAPAPLVTRDRALGTLTNYYRAGEEPDEREIAFLCAIADHAAVAIENARLYEQAQEETRRTAALAGIASSVALGDPLEATMDRLAHAVVEATGSVSSIVLLSDDDATHPRLGGMYGLPEGGIEAIQATRRRGGFMSGLESLRHGQPIVRRNFWQTVHTLPEFAPLRPFAGRVDWDTIVSVPLIARGQLVGVLTNHYRRGHEPSDDEIAFLGAIADHAAVAIENARRYDQLQEEMRKTTALAQIAASLTVDQSMEETLDALAAGAVRAARADAAAVILTDPVTARAQYAGTAGFPEGLAARLMTLPGEATGLGARDELLAQGEPEIMRNMKQWVLENPHYAPVHDYVTLVDWETSVGMPMVFHGRMLGFVNAFYGPQKTPGPDEIALLRPIADQAALAVENARLFLDARDKASLEERTRLAHDLHDSVTQTVFSLGMLARAAQAQHERRSAKLGHTLERVATLAQDALVEMRALLFELRPASLSEEGLAGALTKLVEGMRPRTSMALRCTAVGEGRLGADAELAVFRIVQEALGNAVKHAQASEAEVRLVAAEATLMVQVRDNGAGFDPATPVAASADGMRGGQGLRSMRERAAAAGLTLSLTSAPGQGTTVTIQARLGAAPHTSA